MGDLQSSQAQQQHSSQQQIQDQNYSNNIMMSVFSTLESISLYIAQRDRNSNSKRYGAYDRVDFTDKGWMELLEQLQVNLGILHASMKGMKSDHREGFVFPRNFPKEKALKELDTLMEICRKEPIVVGFCQDLKLLLNGRLTGLTYDKVKIRSGQTQRDKKAAQGSVLRHGVQAQRQMQNRSKYVQKMKIKNAQSLEININESKGYKQKTSGEPKQAPQTATKSSWSSWLGF